MSLLLMKMGWTRFLFFPLSMMLLTGLGAGAAFSGSLARASPERLVESWLRHNTIGEEQGGAGSRRRWAEASLDRVGPDRGRTGTQWPERITLRLVKLKRVHIIDGQKFDH